MLGKNKAVDTWLVYGMWARAFAVGVAADAVQGFKLILPVHASAQRQSRATISAQLIVPKDFLYYKDGGNNMSSGKFFVLNFFFFRQQRLTLLPFRVSRRQGVEPCRAAPTLAPRRITQILV